MKPVIFTKEDGTVFGKVKKTQDNTYKAYWVVPVGYYNGGDDFLIGEYATKKIAEEKCIKWIQNKWEQQEECKKERSKDKSKSFIKHFFCR